MGDEKQDLLKLQRQLIPDLLDVMKKRYRILHHLHLVQPIGRRGLAQQLQMTERILRAETDFLKEQGLVDMETVGMRLSAQGGALLEQLADVVREFDGLADKERRLAARLGLEHVRIVPGDADVDPLALKAMGHAAAEYLKKNLRQGDTLAVTGGTATAAVAEAMPRTQLGVDVVPARGGLGSNLAFQANTIASTLATKLGGSYRLLHMPDLVSEEAFSSMGQDPETQETLRRIREARMVVHGIGQAIPMARRRQLDASKIEELAAYGAVAEAFGYYLDRTGHIVHAMNTIGLRLADLKQMERIVAVAGGRNKSEAIVAVANAIPLKVLVTDEGAADAILG
ncbi:MAG TPA: sugar-binding domain-containing protein [Bacilli bacterium]|nr:sugar-binding domain-containing protein [Bacilli bacterium]